MALGTKPHRETGRRIRVRGQVQGVGFRPFVWKLAKQMAINGAVWNDAEGVHIIASGGDLDAFEAALRTQVPVLARIDSIVSTIEEAPDCPSDFIIAGSRGAGSDTGVTPDAATCGACLAEIRDSSQRRYRYAFANCTQCGPRFSILRAIPYDREMTSMVGFSMCAACRAEYEDPGDRRFHAQPIACPACGPRLWLEANGREIAGDAIHLSAQRLQQGEILAIKGLGGFHLACDARNPDAIATLRARKQRPAKALALMGALSSIRRHSNVSPDEEALLSDPGAVIVLLDKSGEPLPEGIAPGLARLGWMLPCTPLHHLLLDALDGPLVMTSGNLSGEPQVIGNLEAREKLGGFADAFLMHDRDIVQRLDDSVERLTPHGPMVLRRGRGRVPGTLPLPPGFEDAPLIAAYGGQIKSSICLLKTGKALLSHHLGDLDDPLTWDAYRQAAADYARLFDHRPSAVACDLHPELRASRFAAAQADDMPLIEVQHHHAHLASCMAENHWPLDADPVAGIVLDGLGLGSDGTIWGGELLVGDYVGFRRAASLTPAPLAGGDAAAREPWRNALMRLDQAGLSDRADTLFREHPRDLLRQAAASGINAPSSSSAGRLFDAMGACLGLAADRQSHEGEAALLLEALAQRARDAFGAPYPFGEGAAGIDPAPMFQNWDGDHADGVPPEVSAARFHAGLALAFATAARREVEAGRAVAVALSGGCFQNALLLDLTLGYLKDLPVLIHTRTPANDGGLALGQAVIAAARIMRGT
jgi:hydrogenase maturation protein HypF